MRRAWLLVPLLFGCSNPSYTTIVVTQPAGFGGNGGGGAGGQGGAATTATTATTSAGQGGAGGLGGGAGDGGTGGQGGTGGACVVDHDAVCAALPGGVCGDVDDGCGSLTHCGNEACEGGFLSCDAPACVCQTLEGWGYAVSVCNMLGLGGPQACGDEPNDDVPAGCTITDKINDDGSRIWCC